MLACTTNFYGSSGSKYPHSLLVQLRMTKARNWPFLLGNVGMYYEFLWIFRLYVLPFPFGTAQNDQRKGLTISAWHVLRNSMDLQRVRIPIPFWYSSEGPRQGTNHFCLAMLACTTNFYGSSQCYLAASDGRHFCFIFITFEYLIWKIPNPFLIETWILNQWMKNVLQCCNVRYLGFKFFKFMCVLRVRTNSVTIFKAMSIFAAVNVYSAHWNRTAAQR